ncbi:MAG TPA: hypothetical protein DEQ64_00210 [Lachnoclostridium sp.]|jgi:hypothetical protein|uniref:DUF5711 family protein n=1 Tax=Lacrimispora sp. TaxID=2719234 RepID=UPI000EBE6513|nr:DUF5711 family protein [Lacrimispora sp.]HCD42176.1 hypothetical protein [Lachnoclostridium sp.]
MSDRNSMNREIKKNQLRRQIVSSSPQEGENSQEIIKKALTRVKKRRIRIALVLFLVLLAGAIGVYEYFTLYQYTQYSVAWAKEMNEGSYVGYLSFGSNVLKYSKDGASYLDSQGKEVWIQSYEMKSPRACVNGNYAAIADQQGNSIYIFDKTGNTGIATTVLPIVKATVSSYGVVAAILEDSTSNYVYFFKRDGSALDVKIKALLGGDSGYPVDIGLSPDGNQLIGAYAYLKNGTLNGRVAFHNFAEIGKSIPDRLVGGFDEPYDSSLVARVQFLDDTYSCAFADNSISFYSTKNELSPELIRQVAVEEEIKSVFYSEKYVGLIVDNPEGENPYRLDVYKPNGNLVFSKAFQYQYTHADIDGDHVILYNEDSCRVYNMSGRLKFAGTFDFPISKIRNGRFPNTLIVTGPQNMKEIRLQIGGQYQ